MKRSTLCSFVEHPAFIVALWAFAIAMILLRSGALDASILHGITCNVSAVHITHGRVGIQSPCAPFDRVFGTGFDTPASAPQAPAHYACTAQVQAHTITAPASGSYTCEVHP